MNPATVSLEKARTLRALGVNRISMGVQSLGAGAPAQGAGPRAHTRRRPSGRMRFCARRASRNVNLDLMFGVPGQTRAQWVASLDRTVALGPEHISAYCLTYEEDTDFFRRFRQRRVHAGRRMPMPISSS